MSERVAVTCRLCPRGGKDERGDITVPKRGRGLITAKTANNNLEFALDDVFDWESTQESVYESIGRARVDRVLNGTDSCVLAYGQTGSGKTHTMFGPDDVMENFRKSDPKNHGIVPRACEQLFAGLRDAPEGSSFLVQCSYVEVYNDKLFDLLGERKEDADGHHGLDGHGRLRPPAVSLRERPGGGAVVDHLTHEFCTGTEEAIALLSRGNEARVTAAMKMNPRSSRGHALFCLHVKKMSSTGGERSGKLTLVDLAGMESSKKSYAVEGPSNSPARRMGARTTDSKTHPSAHAICCYRSRGRATRVCAGAARGGQEHQPESVRAGLGRRAPLGKVARARALPQLDAG